MQTNYDFSHFSKEDYIEFTKDLLEAEYQIRLERPPETNTSSHLALVTFEPMEKSFKAERQSVDSIVLLGLENIGEDQNPSKFAEMLSQSIQTYEPFKIYILIFHKLEIRTHYLIDELVSRSKSSKFQTLDLKDIQSLLATHEKLIDKWGLTPLPDPSELKSQTAQTAQQGPSASETIDIKPFVSIDDLTDLNVDDILYARSNGSYSDLFTSKAKHSVSRNLKDLERYLGGYPFLRVNRYYLVNLNRADRMEDDVIYIGEENIKIGKAYKKNLDKHLVNLQGILSIDQATNKGKKSEQEDEDERDRKTEKDDNIFSLLDNAENYWIWNVPVAKPEIWDQSEGETVLIDPKYKSGKRIANSDLVIGFKAGSNGGFFGLFDVAGMERDDVLRFQYKQSFESIIPRSAIAESNPSLEINRQRGNLQKISRFTISEILYQAGLIVNAPIRTEGYQIPDEDIPPGVRSPLKPYINNDGLTNLDDQLGISPEVESFAMLLASKDVKPPLAIALFGPWGSGKSFFMKLLARKIDELSKYQRFLAKDEEPPSSEADDGIFCKGIAQIEFNAWSYLDANLWAGIAHSLFEKLNEYINGQTKSDLERLKIKVKLSKRLQLLHADLQNYQNRRTSLQDLKARLKREKENKILRYVSGEYDETVKNFLEKNGLDPEITQQLLPSQLKRKVEKVVTLFSFWKNNPREFFLKVFLLVFVLVVAHRILAQNTDILEDGWEALKSWWLTVTVAITPVIHSLWSFWKKKQQTISQAAGLMQEIRKLEEGKQPDKELTKTEKEIEEIEQLIREVENTIDATDAVGNDISQMAIANFLSNRHQQKDYTDRLGIISIIRKDFETLSELFLQPTDPAEEDSELTDDRDIIKEQFKEGKTLNRIILYIDDLDRCADEKVLEVIQAVHLLMAFPLFNVVVGVDKRCVYNALNHRNRYQYSQFGSQEELEDAGIRTVLPGEYLEKIFQIPFELNKLTDHQLQKLTHKIMKDAVLKPEPATNEKPLPKPDSDQQRLPDPATVKESPGEEKEDSFGIVKNPEGHLHQEDETNNEAEPESAKANEDEEPVSSPVPADLLITPEEFIYLKELTWLAGETPRTVKRFLNIFRLVRAHENWERPEQASSANDFLAAMFVLAVGIGKYRPLANALYEMLEADARDKDSRTLAKVLKILGGDRDYTSYVGDIEEYLTCLVAQPDGREANKSVKALLEMKSDQFVRHLPFVKRFSFKIKD